MKVKWQCHVTWLGELRNAHKILVGKPEEKKHHGRSRRMWKDNIKMYPTEIGCDDVDWIHLVQNRVQWRAVVYTAVNLRVR
jgi:hypothetical protein